MELRGMTESVKPLMNANEIIIEQTKEGVADNAVSVVVTDQLYIFRWKIWLILSRSLRD